MRVGRVRSLRCWACLLLILTAGTLRADDPKPSPENTISVTPEAVKPQSFAIPVKFFIGKIVDRSGRAQPMLLFEKRGGVFLDREPVAVVREALELSLRSADLLAADASSATHVLNVYIFHFGLGESSGREYFGKIELNIVVKNTATGKSQTVTAMGTSIQGVAVRKKNIMKNMQENMQAALQDVVRNFLRGTKLRDAVSPSVEQPAASASE